MKKTKKNAQREREELRRMVGRIPSLIIGQNDTLSAMNAHTSKKPIADMVTHERRKYHWLWFGVCIFSLAIFFVWFYHIRTFLSDLKLSGSAEQDVFEQSKYDLEHTLQLLSEKEQPRAEDTDFTDTLKESLATLFTFSTSSLPEAEVENPEEAETP